MQGTLEVFVVYTQSDDGEKFSPCTTYEVESLRECYAIIAEELKCFNDYVHRGLITDFSILPHLTRKGREGGIVLRDL